MSQPILLLALEDYFNEPTPAVLKRMYDAINSVDTSLAPSLSLDERMVLRCSERRDLFEEKFDTAEDGALSPTTRDASGGHTASNPEERSNHLGVPSDQQPRTRVASDNSNASVAGVARASNGKIAVSGTAKSKTLRDTHYFETCVYYNDLSLPIRLPLYTFPNEVGDVSAHILLLTLHLWLIYSAFLLSNSILSLPLYPPSPTSRAHKDLNIHICIRTAH